ncbi:MAG: carboxypeptidase regulatory-like domain-containing protein [Acidobacteria bacterium]|nr:carboxypeptidase regulatory-like domain-containing protein [Acidobacteriota bacterium]
MTERSFSIHNNGVRTRLSFLLLFSFLTVCGIPREALSAGPRSGGRVEGLAVSTLTGAPIAGVTIWLDRVPEPDLAPRRKAVTDENGYFAYNRVHPGSYRIFAEKSGYLPADLQSQYATDGRWSLRVRGGEVISNLQINLQMGGRVEGLVLDEQANPAAGFVVKVLRLRRSGDSIATIGVATTRTDTNGQYRLEGLYPGRYLIRAERQTRSLSEMHVEYAYYPGGGSWESAAAVDVAADALASGLNLTFAPQFDQPVIAGTVTDVESGLPLKGVKVSVVEGSNLGGSAETGEDGSYRFKGLAPGDYTVSVQGESVGDGYAWITKKANIQPGHNRLDFSLSASPLILGTVEFIGSGPAPARNDYMISIRQEGASRGVSFNGLKEFQFRGLRPGKAAIGVGFASLQYGVSAILHNGQDITGQTLELQPGEKVTGVRVLITDDPSAIAMTPEQVLAPN